MPGKGRPQRLTAAVVYLSPGADARSDLATIGARWRDKTNVVRSVIPRRAARRSFAQQLVAQFAADVSAL